MEEIKHFQVNGKYRVQYERSATKGVDGFKVEANGDEYPKVLEDAQSLYVKAILTTSPSPVTVEVK
jgi:hypothetical protein